MNAYALLAEKLVMSGYATEMKPTNYGLTKSIIYCVNVPGEGWLLVNPFDKHCQHSRDQYLALQNYIATFES